MHSAQTVPLRARFFRHDNIAQMTHDCLACNARLQGAYIQSASNLHTKLQATRLPGYQATRLPGYQATSCEPAGLPACRPAGLPACRPAGLGHVAVQHGGGAGLALAVSVTAASANNFLFFSYNVTYPLAKYR